MAGDTGLRVGSSYKLAVLNAEIVIVRQDLVAVSEIVADSVVAVVVVPEGEQRQHCREYIRRPNAEHWTLIVVFAMEVAVVGESKLVQEESPHGSY